MFIAISKHLICNHPFWYRQVYFKVEHSWIVHKYIPLTSSKLIFTHDEQITFLIVGSLTYIEGKIDIRHISISAFKVVCD